MLINILKFDLRSSYLLVATSDRWKIALRWKASRNLESAAEAGMLHRTNRITAISTRVCVRSTRNHKWRTNIQAVELGCALLRLRKLSLHCECNEQEKQCCWGAPEKLERRHIW